MAVTSFKYQTASESEVLQRTQSFGAQISTDFNFFRYTEKRPISVKKKKSVEIWALNLAYAGRLLVVKGIQMEKLIALKGQARVIDTSVKQETLATGNVTEH